MHNSTVQQGSLGGRSPPSTYPCFLTINSLHRSMRCRRRCQFSTSRLADHLRYQYYPRLLRFLYYPALPPNNQKQDPCGIRIRTAHCRSLHFRFPNELRDPKRHSGFANFVRKRWTRGVLFGSAVFQASKRYYYTEIPLKHTCACVYLISSFIIEILVSRHGFNPDVFLRATSDEKTLPSSGSMNLLLPALPTG
jgi:hypothetical protein